jgi:toxin-antitoxin system PIN domain toxin
VNVLVALAWPNHVHHRRAVTWFVSIRDDGWATCPITESGFVRVSSNARVLPDARTPSEARTLLAALRTKGAHRFWEDDVSVVDDPCGVFAAAFGHRQVTDAHLLTLAIRRGGALATFDRGIMSLATDHPDSVVVIDG